MSTEFKPTGSGVANAAAAWGALSEAERQLAAAGRCLHLALIWFERTGRDELAQLLRDAGMDATHALEAIQEIGEVEQRG